MFSWHIKDSHWYFILMINPPSFDLFFTTSISFFGGMKIISWFQISLWVTKTSLWFSKNFHINISGNKFYSVALYRLNCLPPKDRLKSQTLLFVNVILFRNWVFDDLIKLSSLEWAQLQYDWCLYKEIVWKQTWRAVTAMSLQRQMLEWCVYKVREHQRLPATTRHRKKKERILLTVSEREKPYWHLNLGFLASKIVR